MPHMLTPHTTDMTKLREWAADRITRSGWEYRINSILEMYARLENSEAEEAIRSAIMAARENKTMYQK